MEFDHTPEWINGWIDEWIELNSSYDVVNVVVNAVDFVVDVVDVVWYGGGGYGRKGEWEGRWGEGDRPLI